MLKITSFGKKMFLKFKKMFCSSFNRFLEAGTIQDQRAIKKKRGQKDTSRSQTFPK